MKPDLLICWLKHCDYPIFRATLRKYRDFFGKVIIYWSEHNRFPYYDHFIHDDLKDLNITFVDPTFTDWSTGEDWRHHATTEMLKYSDSEWVCSIEQDWFAKDWTALLNRMKTAMTMSELTGWLNPTQRPYVHPAFWFIKRSLLDKIGADFTPHSEIPGSDHFAMITYKAIEAGATMLPIQDLGFKTDITTPEETDCFHLGGVNQNYLDFDQRFKENTIHRSELFYIYNYYSSNVNINKHDLFKKQMEKVDVHLYQRHRDFNPITSGWRKFFTYEND